MSYKTHPSTWPPNYANITYQRHEIFSHWSKMSPFKTLSSHISQDLSILFGTLASYATAGRIFRNYLKCVSWLNNRYFIFWKTCLRGTHSHTVGGCLNWHNLLQSNSARSATTANVHILCLKTLLLRILYKNSHLSAPECSQMHCSNREKNGTNPTAHQQGIGQRININII